MAKRVVGIYHSEQEVRETVEQLQKEGHQPEDISLIANDRDETSWIRSETDIQSESLNDEDTNRHEPSFWEKVKAAFTGEDAEHPGSGNHKSKFTDLGLTNDQAAEYEDDVKNGRIVVLAPETPTGTPGEAGTSTKTDTFTENLTDNAGERRIKDAPPNVEGTKRAGDPLKDEEEASSDRLVHDTPPNVEGTKRAGDSLKDEEDASADRLVHDTPPNVEGTKRAGDPLKSENSGESISSAGETEDERKIRLRKEELEVNKEEIQTGEVEVEKEVHEETKKVDVPVTREEAYVERKPVTDQKSADAGGKMEDETINVPLKEEKVDVKKKPVVTEEVKVGKKKVEDTEQVSETVKREDIKVDREVDERK
ncbi:MAG: YsnF/AvaK domain-containing protein [Alkalicoccus sp.]|nr:MAG: YsnF/AvaK domain-containing protein [Alkalicoccus sp.]